MLVPYQQTKTGAMSISHNPSGPKAGTLTWLAAWQGGHLYCHVGQGTWGPNSKVAQGKYHRHSPVWFPGRDLEDRWRSRRPRIQAATATAEGQAARKKRGRGQGPAIEQEEEEPAEAAEAEGGEEGEGEPLPPPPPPGFDKWEAWEERPCAWRARAAYYVYMMYRWARSRLLAKAAA
jgi:hypothetical protein